MRKITLFPFLFLTQLVTGFAGESHMYFGVENGLPQSSVQCIAQDKIGNLWIGTRSGVSRFNGVEFKNYFSSDGLAEDGVTACLVTPDGEIWLGHFGGGISKYNPGVDKFETLNLPGISLTKPILSLFKTKNGLLWAGTGGNGLVSIQTGENHKINGSVEGFFSKSVMVILPDGEKHLLLGTDLGLVRIDLEGKAAEKIFNDRLPSVEVTALQSERTQKTWVGLGNGEVWVIAADNSKARKIRNSTGQPIQGFSIDASGFVSIAVKGRGLEKYKQEDLTFQIGPEILPTPVSVDFNQTELLCLFVDKEQNLWAGTSTGLWKVSETNLEIFLKDAGEAGKQVFSICRNKSSNEFWVGTGEGIFYSQNPNAENPKFFPLSNCPNGKILTLCQEDENLWFSVQGKGLYFLNLTQKKLNGPIFTGLVEGNEIVCMLTANKGELWLGFSRIGVVKLDTKTLKYKEYGISDGFQSLSIQSLVNDKNGNIWFGTRGGFLTKFDGEKFKTYSNAQGLASKNIMALALDKNARLICGSYQGEIFEFDQEKDRFEKIQHVQGISILAIIHDFDGNLWAGTSTGLKRIYLKEEKIPAVEEGFKKFELNQGAAINDELGQFWLGTLSGLVRFHPGRKISNPYLPFVQISAIQVNSKPWNQASIPSLKYNENYISFFFEGITMTKAEEVKFRYQLEGIDKDFSQPSAQRSVTYPGLAPAKYNFRVMASNSEGKWTEPVSFSFSIHPPFWKTGWFRLAAALLLAALTFAGFRVRIHQVKLGERKQAALDKKIAALELAALRSQMNPHFIFNTLNSIQHFVLSKNAEKAGAYLTKFASLMRAILDNSKLSTIPLADEIKHLNLYLELESMRFENKFGFHIDISSVPDPDFIEIPTMLIQPFVENAIVHGMMHKVGPGMIHLKFSFIGSTLHCTIEDNGIGREKAAEIRNQQRPQHISHAMSISRERLEIYNQTKGAGEPSLKYEITDLRNAEGKPAGTKVEISIPVVMD